MKKKNTPTISALAALCGMTEIMKAMAPGEELTLTVTYKKKGSGGITW